MNKTLLDTDIFSEVLRAVNATVVVFDCAGWIAPAVGTPHLGMIV